MSTGLVKYTAYDNIFNSPSCAVPVKRLLCSHLQDATSWSVCVDHAMSVCRHASICPGMFEVGILTCVWSYRNAEWFINRLMHPCDPRTTATLLVYLSRDPKRYGDATHSRSALLICINGRQKRVRISLMSTWPWRNAIFKTRPCQSAEAIYHVSPDILCA